MTNVVFMDLMEKDLNIYEFTRVGNDYELTDTRSVSIENGFSPSVLDSLFEEKPDNLYVSLPLDLLTLREQSFPFADKEKIQDTIAYELEGTLLDSIDSYSIDHIITETFDDSSKVMAVCLEKTKLQEIIWTFSSAGLNPKVITSIDLWLYGGKGEDYLGKPISDRSVRAETARKELDSPSINLRQDELAYTGDVEKFIKRIRVTAVLLLVLLVLIGVFSTIRLTAAKKENRELSGQMQALYRKVFPGEKKVIDVGRQFQGKYNTLRKKKEALAGISMLDILLDVALKNDRAATFHELNADGKNIIIKGTAGSFEDVESIKNSFAQSFSTVKVTDSTSSADKKVAFTIQMMEKKL
jgi:type II secretory pathway component PulL